MITTVNLKMQLNQIMSFGDVTLVALCDRRGQSRRLHKHTDTTHERLRYRQMTSNKM